MFACRKSAAGKNRLPLTDQASHIRQATADELDAVFQLNLQVFPEAWSKEGLASALHNGFDLYVDIQDGQLRGYCLSHDILDETHILQVAVSPSCRRQGIARQLTSHLLTTKAHQACILLEVRASNQAAQKLYQQLGFQTDGLRPNYYQPQQTGDVHEDAILMRLVI